MALPRGQPPAPGRGEQDFDLPAEALSRVGAPPESAAWHSKPMAMGILTEDARLVRVVQPVWPLTGLDPHDVHGLAIVIVWRADAALVVSKFSDRGATPSQAVHCLVAALARTRRAHRAAPRPQEA